MTRAESARAVADRSCPCCGQSWSPGRSKLDARRLCQDMLASSGQMARVLKMLLAHFGQWIPTVEMVRFVYEDAYHGQPSNAHICVAVAISRLRKKVAPFGLKIEGKARSGSRLIWSKVTVS